MSRKLYDEQVARERYSRRSYIGPDTTRNGKPLLRVQDGSIGRKVLLFKGMDRKYLLISLTTNNMNIF